jgi:5-methylcytosine-specific restriction endonuclease McrA
MNPITKKSVKLTGKAWARLVDEAYRRDGQVCQLCMVWQFRHNLHPHHIIPRGRLRLDILDNLLTVCWGCHTLLHDDLLDVSVDDLIDAYGLRGYLWTS